MQYKTICFIGAGNMSRSIISGLVANGYPADLITASNPSQPKLDELAATFSVNITQNNQQAAAQSQVVVLAVKPQLMETMCQQLALDANAQLKLFVSLAAGINAQRLEEMLGQPISLVRTMPNTPSLLGKGMTGLFANKRVNSADKQYCENLMSYVGEALWVDDEAKIDAIIATAGSSPAYFFMFLEAMQEKAMHLGLSKEEARLLAQQAMLGSAAMVCENPHLELSELRAQVTSKGGTTAKAVEHFQGHGLSQLVQDAMQAAVDRAQQMSQEF